VSSCRCDDVPYGMPSAASCFECMEEGNLPASAPARRLERDRPASTEGEHDSVVYAAIVDAGGRGLTLGELEERTGLRNRVLQNVTWRLEVKQNPGWSRPPGPPPPARPVGVAAGNPASRSSVAGESAAALVLS
jgi:hypothetical protein